MAAEVYSANIFLSTVENANAIAVIVQIVSWVLQIGMMANAGGFTLHTQSNLIQSNRIHSI